MMAKLVNPRTALVGGGQSEGVGHAGVAFLNPERVSPLWTFDVTHRQAYRDAETCGRTRSHRCSALGSAATPTMFGNAARAWAAERGRLDVWTKDLNKIVLYLEWRERKTPAPVLRHGR